MSSLSHKTILLTGATSGIGKELLIVLLEQGANVAFCGRSPEKMEVLKNGLNQFHSTQIYSETFCLSDEHRIIGFVKAAHDHFGKIDILINNAGLNNNRDAFTQLSTTDLDWMMTINFRAPVIFMREAGNIMIAQQEGLVVNILSSVCLFSNEGLGGYTASKAALDAATKVYRKEMRKHNIRVLSVYPGGVDTPFRTGERPEYLTAKQVAGVMINALKTESAVALDELVLRPMVERNF
ncbi:MAG: SDR family oxidoreductase [Salinivirgaceae bacterium]|nr:SDR family oxidoreductase [Salinivirgaceae bacterium]